VVDKTLVLMCIGDENVVAHRLYAQHNKCA
jgi:hypothetical protein